MRRLWDQVSGSERPPRVNLHYDAHQFGNKRARPVSVKTGLSFQDYASMQTFTRKQSGERRLPTPYWALNDKLFRELLVVFMEARVGIRTPTGTLIERLERARLAALAQHPRMNDTVDRLNTEYVQTQRGGVSEEEVARRNAAQPTLPGFEEEALIQATNDRLAELEVEIEGIDTYLRYTRNGGAGVLAQVVYLYYRVGLDSVGVAEETGLKPPHVRQLLWRLNELWKERFGHVKAETGELPPEPLFGFLENDSPQS